MTAAHSADLDLPGFEPAQPPPERAGALIDITGVLIQDAEVRVHPVAHDAGVAFLPVLCVDLHPDQGVSTRLHCEVPYTTATRAQADSLAATLKKGTHVQLRTSLEGMRVTLPHVRSVQIANHPAP